MVAVMQCNTFGIGTNSRDPEMSKRKHTQLCTLSTLQMAPNVLKAQITLQCADWLPLFVVCDRCWLDGPNQLRRPTIIAVHAYNEMERETIHWERTAWSNATDWNTKQYLSKVE